MRYLIYLTILLLIVSVGVLVIYCNGGLKENNFSSANDNILVQDRVAGAEYYDAIPNKWSMGRCNRIV